MQRLTPSTDLNRGQRYELLVKTLTKAKEVKEDKESRVIIEKLCMDNLGIVVYANFIYQNLINHKYELMELETWLLAKLKPADESIEDFKIKVFDYVVNQLMYQADRQNKYWEDTAVALLQNFKVNLNKSNTKWEWSVYLPAYFQSLDQALTAYLIDYYCQQCHEAKEISESAFIELNHLFNKAIASECQSSKESELVLLNKFILLNDLDFQPVIDSHSINSICEAWYASSIVKSPIFKFLDGNFHAALEESVAGINTVVQFNDEDRMAFMKMGVNPHAFNYLNYIHYQNGRSPQMIRQLNEYAVKVLNAIEQYALENAAKFKVHEYKLFCGRLRFWGGKKIATEQGKIRLPHGVAFYVQSAQEARKNPHNASKLLSKVLKHAGGISGKFIDDYKVGHERFEYEKPKKRNQDTHNFYLAINRLEVAQGFGDYIAKCIRESHHSKVMELKTINDHKKYGSTAGI